MTTLEFLSYLRSRGVKIWIEGDKLRFKAPEKSLTPELHAELAGRKSEIIQFLSQLKDDSHAGMPPIRPASRDQALPLSFSQQRLWFLDQLDPGVPSYSIYDANELVGPLNIGVLIRTLSELVRRHETLRTTFKSVNGAPVQIIAPPAVFHLPLVDLSALPEAERMELGRDLATQEAQRPFDLQQGPLFRAKLIRLEKNRYLWLLTIHHIIADDWSMKLLDQELVTLYIAFAQGLPSPLPEVPIQYADFAVWQREWLQGEILEAHVAFWKEQLSGDLPVLQMPTDRVRPKHQSYKGTRQDFIFPKSLSIAIKALSDREGVTPFMTLMAAYTTLLSRYTGQEDIIVGCPIAGRHQLETEKLIGFFLSTLLIRTKLSGRPTFRELLKQVREVCLGAHAHQEVPYEALLERLRLKRDLSRTPLFQTMFALLNTPPITKARTEFESISLHVNNGTTKFDLSLTMTEADQLFYGVVDYSTDLFDGATITRLLEHFQRLLEQVVEDPGQRISELSLLSEAQRHELLVDWSGQDAEFAERLCIHQLFEAQVERTPEAVAVEGQGQRLSYAELNARANQLAHFLQKQGAGAETLVGICLERTPQMVVALLGVLKSGAAYVPLDPAYPQSRLAFMVQDAQVKVLLTEQHLVERLPEHGAAVTCLDRAWERERIEQESRENPVCKVRSQNAVYVIYTSGSTGKPKGAIISHGSLVNYTQSAVREYGVEEGDRVLQFASLSFDTSAEEIYPCLTGGATLVLRSAEMLDSVGGFTGRCRELGITVLNLPTAYWHEVVGRLGVEELAVPENLRLVIIGGERALPEKLGMWRKFIGERLLLVNTYGPTEATIVTTRSRLAGASGSEGGEGGGGAGGGEGERGGREVTIGRAIENARVYVLDGNMQPVPVGIAGELYIGGVGLARGYVGRAEVTAEKFVPNPFSEKGGERLYRSGDLVKYLRSGELEYVGRIDQQVKIRGYRIELGEIEAVLGEQEGVKDGVVVVREDEPGQKQLVGYVVRAEGSEVGVSELRSYLKEKLPEYMVPGAFVFLEKLPLTGSGKIDREGLPRPDGSRPELKKEFVGARTKTEEELASIWGEMLRLDKVGIHDNFFELGGHSLLATQILSRVREVLHVDIPLRTIFEMPTIMELAQFIEASGSSGVTDLEEIAKTLEQLERLSEEEVLELLKQRVG